MSCIIYTSMKVIKDFNSIIKGSICSHKSHCNIQVVKNIKRKPSMQLIAFTTPEVCRVLQGKCIWKKKNHPAIWQHSAPHHSPVHIQNSEEQLGTLSTSTLHSVPSSLGLPSVHLHNASDGRPALWNQWGSPGSHPLLFTNSLNIEWWQKCIDQEGGFVGKCTDLIAAWCFPIHTFTWLWN